MNKPQKEQNPKREVRVLSSQQEELLYLRKTCEELKAQNYTQEMSIKELSNTNNHLVAATWRERELKKELSAQKQLIEYQNKQINESINYSRKIQQAINTSEETLRFFCDNVSLLYKPKDVVSGDFPWSKQIDEYFYFAVVDCTGHGVPGAMLAIMANIYLNTITAFFKPRTGLLLEKLNALVVDLLKQGDNSLINDGLDIAVCKYNQKTGVLEYSGAFVPMYYVSGGELEVIKATRRPIGGTQYDVRTTKFDTVVKKVQKGDRVFIFSDGFKDQFQGIEGKKIGAKNLRNLIARHSSTPIDEVKNRFEEYWTDWKGEGAQTDDMLMMCFEF